MKILKALHEPIDTQKVKDNTMKITRLNNSSTTASYQLQAEDTLDTRILTQLGADALADYVEPFNYGGFIESRTDDKVLIKVYLD